MPTVKEWERHYNPWWLFTRALLLVGVQALTLSITYWQVCEWNVKGIPITVQCNKDIHGMMAYPCEGTLAFARCFPLLAISVSLVVAARFMLQARMYYELLQRKAILNFQNYHFAKDPATLLLAVCLLAGLLHFVLDLFMPPHLPHQYFTKAQNTWKFVSPCIVFFVVFERGCNTEKHLPTLNDLYEEDAGWAKEHLNASKLYSEKQLHDSACEVLEGIEQNPGKAPFSLDGLLDEIIKGATPSRGTSYEGEGDESALLGLWPAPVLLAKNLTDNNSRAYKLSMRVFMIIFVVVHMILLGILAGSTLREILDIIPGQRPLGSYLPVMGLVMEEVDGSLYQSLGSGYCRDEGSSRPDCDWFAWKDLNNESEIVSEISASAVAGERALNHSLISLRFNISRTTLRESETFRDRDLLNIFSALSASFEQRLAGACSGWLTGWYTAARKGARPTGNVSAMTEQCGKYCDYSACIGFSVDDDYCTIYNARPQEEPPGWTKCAATSNITSLSQIVQTNSFETALCLKKLTLKGESEDIVSAAVSALHVCLVGFFMVWTFQHLKHE
mmetsp:Transcript_82445/g.146128  ORF Transcript_82445/g.146128 Transcript_82445/m.146128 type:complete len:559 (-) Transcript_82445:132-1808(-)